VTPGKVWLVGAGPGDPGLLTLRGARAIAACDAIVYDRLVSAAILAMASPACEKIYVGKKAGTPSIAQGEITALLVRLAHAGKRVVRLKGGDPFVFARGGEEAADLRAAGIPFEIVPGITSALAVPAYAGIPATHRDHNTTITIATGHEDPTEAHSSLDFSKLANAKQTLVFLMAMANLPAIVAKLREHGLPDDLPVAIVRDGTKPTQETLLGTLATIVDEVARVAFEAPAVVVIGTVVNERETLRWFDTNPLFGKRVLVTRARESADEFAEKLWERGAEPLVAPAIAIGPPDDPAPARAVLERLNTYAWVAFTSQNGVDACFAGLAAANADARRFGATKVAAIGTKTAARLLERGIRADYVPEEFVAERIAVGLLERTRPGDRILIYGAQEMRPALARALREAGRPVDTIAAYQTTHVHDATLVAHAAAADVWTFTSGSTVASFVENVPHAAELARTKIVACIGPVTADAAREHGLPVHVVAGDATVDGLILALDAAHALS